MWLILIFFILLILQLYLRVSKIYKYWERKGVPFSKPWIFFGNMISIVLQTRSMINVIEDSYKTYHDKRYVGWYSFMTPTLLIRDPELIKTITIKEFDTFPNRGECTNKDIDPIVSRSLFSLAMDEGWHIMRAKVSPSFTGCKMRVMFTLMDKCANQFIDYFHNQDKIITLEMKDAFTKYTNDIIASTAFGINSNSLENPTNEFYLMSKDLNNFNGIRSFKFIGYVISPKLMKLLRISVFSKPACEFFKQVVKESLKIREEKKIVRPDLIYLLMEARKGSQKDDENEIPDKEFAIISETVKPAKKDVLQLTVDDITAQTLGFFFAGFEGTSTLMSYVAYELALNPTIQRRLREEVDKTLKICKEKLTYETLIGMRYLDKVISETLRKWPSEFISDRRSQRPFTIEADKPGEQLLYLESGTVCWIPIFSIHRDPKYYPDPEKFDPERFSEKNKHKIKPFTYLPFGSGPRSCVGSRFALLETKLIILRILQKFEIVPVKKTQIPIKLTKKSFNLMPEGGFWLGLKPRAACL